MRDFSAFVSQEIWIAKHVVTGKCIFIRRGESYPCKDYSLVIEVTANKVMELILKETT